MPEVRLSVTKVRLSIAGCKMRDTDRDEIESHLVCGRVLHARNWLLPIVLNQHAKIALMYEVDFLIFSETILVASLSTRLEN